MREIRASATLTIYHDGQFWVGMFECVEGGRLSVSRLVFGAEPSAEEVVRLVCDGWCDLRFTQPVEGDAAPRAHTNPKRRQREASRALSQRVPSTKAQQAIAEAREQEARSHKAELREQRERERQDRFEQRRERRRQRHRGR